MTEALRRRILLVEDEESLVLTLTDRLESEGYVVESAGDGNTALEKGSHEQYDRMKEDYPDMTPAEYNQMQDAAAPFLGDEIDLSR